MAKNCEDHFDVVKIVLKGISKRLQEDGFIADRPYR
jgi:hypothetical protein